MAKKYMIYFEQHGETVALCNRLLSSRRDAETIASDKMKNLKAVFPSSLGYEQRGSFCKDGHAVLKNDATGHKISLRITAVKDGIEYLKEGLDPKDLKVVSDEKLGSFTNSVQSVTMAITHIPTNVKATITAKSQHKARDEAMVLLIETLRQKEFN